MATSALNFAEGLPSSGQRSAALAAVVVPAAASGSAPRVVSIDSSDIKNNSILSADIRNLTIRTDDLFNCPVTAEKMINGTVASAVSRCGCLLQRV